MSRFVDGAEKRIRKPVDAFFDLPATIPAPHPSDSAQIAALGEALGFVGLVLG
jgi:hypothetical protein